MTTTYDVTIHREHAYADDIKIEAATPQKALKAIRRRVADDDNFDYAHYDGIGDIQSIEIARDGVTLAGYISPGERLRQHAEELLAAAEKVIARWERGDLAAAVRELNAAVDQAKAGAA